MILSMAHVSPLLAEKHWQHTPVRKELAQSFTRPLLNDGSVARVLLWDTGLNVQLYVQIIRHHIRNIQLYLHLRSTRIKC